MAKVAVFGAGVAGLTAAHELKLRGYEVHVYERRDPTDPYSSEARSVGGKARTQYSEPIAGAGAMPGEHGYRFFPAWYSNVIDTMKRIPTEDSVDPIPSLFDEIDHNVAEQHLIVSPAVGVARRNQPMSRSPQGGPESLWEVAEAVNYLFNEFGGMTGADILQVGTKLGGYWFRGPIEKLRFDGVSFWDFIDGPSLSVSAQELVKSLPVMLVAMKPEQGSARTLSDILFLMSTDQFSGEPPHRILNGPTTVKWLEPWFRWLKEELGVEFHFGEAGTLASFDFDAGTGRITGARLSSGDTVTADHYVCALPIERVQAVINNDMRTAAPDLDALCTIRVTACTGWMVGMQLYLGTDEPLIDGHVTFNDSAWVMSAISQKQFWKFGSNFTSEAGGGVANGIISIDISQWFGVNGPQHGKPASETPKSELLEDVVAQIQETQLQSGNLISLDVIGSHLDNDLVPASGRSLATNDSPLLIHPPCLWGYRPNAWTGIENLLVASDYVRNLADLATMEGANEAARRAVNAILARAGVPAAEWCDVRDPKERAPGFLRTLWAARDEWYQLLNPDAPQSEWAVTPDASCVPGGAFAGDGADQVSPAPGPPRPCPPFPGPSAPWHAGDRCFMEEPTPGAPDDGNRSAKSSPPPNFEDHVSPIDQPPTLELTRKDALDILRRAETEFREFSRRWIDDRRSSDGEKLALEQISPASKPLARVIADLEGAILQCKARHNASGYFAVLYQEVTKNIQAHIIEGSFFENNQIVERFAEGFAARYLDAWRAWLVGGVLTESWRLIFEAGRTNDGVAMQHVLLGINAHANLDLGIAAFEVAENLPKMQDLRNDFLKVNEVLMGMINDFQGKLNRLGGLGKLVDGMMFGLDEALFGISLKAARELAWQFALQLNAVRHDSSTIADIIRKKDVEVTDLGRRVLRPPLWSRPLLLLARQLEHRNVAENIDRLRA